MGRRRPLEPNKLLRGDLKMKKKILVWMLVAVMSISALAGCGKTDNGSINAARKRESAEEVAPTRKPTEVPTPEPTGTPTTEPTVTPTPKVRNTDYSQPNCDIALADRELYHYDMKLSLDAENKTVSGHVKFDFFNDSEDVWDELCFRDYPSMFTMPEKVGMAKGLEIGGALTKIDKIIDGRDRSELTYERAADVSVIWIKPEKPLQPHEKMTLEYDFVTKIPEIGDRFGAETGIYNLANFYPILAEYTDGKWSQSAFFSMGECFYSEVANYDVAITVPYGFIIASTGTENGKQEDGDTVTYTFDAPCVRDFVFSASPKFVKETEVFGDVTVNVFYREKTLAPLQMPSELPVTDGGVNGDEDGNDDEIGGIKVKAQDYSDSVQAAFEAAESSLTIFGYAFGRYPYPELDIVICPLAAGGMEYPNLIQVTEEYCEQVSMYDDADGKIGKMMLDEFVCCVAHEIGHQWFMGIVGSDSGMQPWLDESMASYTEYVFADYLHEVVGVKEYYPFSLMTKPTGDYTNPEITKGLLEEGTLPIDRSYYDYKDGDHYVISVYANGQRVLRQMEEILGTDEFYSVIREYVGTHAFTNVKPEDFFEVLYRHAGTHNEELNALIENCFSTTYLQ